MSNSNNRNNEIISILKDIFYEMPNNENEFLPIIKNSNNIVKIISFLVTYNNTEDEYINLDINLLTILKNFFKLNSNLIPLFMKNSISSYNTTFYESLINLYLNEKINDNNRQTLEELLNFINNNYSLSKTSLEFIYQNLSKYFTNEAKVKLTDRLLLRYLNLLNHLYTDTSAYNKYKQIKNYIYFNGYNSELNLKLNKSSCNLNTDFPTLEKGCSFVFWINLDKNLIEEYFKVLADKASINLIKINIGGQILSLKLINPDNIIISNEENISNKIEISKIFKYSEWNNIIFIIEPSNDEKLSTKLFINKNLNKITLALNKNLNLKDKILSINLFENLLGKISSILFFSFTIENNLISHLCSIKGFYKNKILIQFLNSFDKEYSNLNNTKNNEAQNIDELKIKLNDQNINNLICCFCPITYEKNNNTIDDVFGNFIGQLNKDDGVNNYKNKNKNIKYLGGINNLLPIIELMIFSLKENNPYKLVEKNILNERTFQEFLIIIQKILINHDENILNEKETHFFSCLSLFMEKIPSKFYTINILQSILGLINLPLTVQNKKDKNSNNFINLILLNERILTKFMPKEQIELWDGVYDIFKKDFVKIKETLSTPKICLLLRFYDEKRYEQYCCKKHASLFNNENIYENKSNIMYPEISIKVGKLFEIIQLYIDNITEDNQVEDIFKLLSLDLSPCLQKKIINLYISHFNSKKVSKETKEKTLTKLLENKYFELTEYVLKVSLLDVRIEIFTLLNIFIRKYKNQIKNYLNKSSIDILQIFYFIGYNLLPDKLIAEINVDKKYDFLDGKQNLLKSYIDIGRESVINEKLLDKNRKYLNLIDYFNEKEYQKDLDSFWGLLNYLFKYRKVLDDENSKTNSKVLVINPFVFNFSIDFVSKVSANYVNEFLIEIMSSIKDDSISNKHIFYNDKIFFPWLIDTIFYFHNVEYIEIINDNDLIQSIQKFSISIICELLSHRRLKEEIFKILKSILDYAYYYKKKYKGNIKYKEIIRITRYLLIKIFECFDQFIDMKSKICFEFMFLFKNSDKIFTEETFHFKEINSFSEKDFIETDEKENNFLNSWETLDSSKDIINLQNYSDNEKHSDSQKQSDSEKQSDNENEINEDDINNSSINDYSDNKKIDLKSQSNSTDMKVQNNFNIINDAALIPNFIYEGINYIGKNEGKNNLENIWSDYKLFYDINNYYRTNVWGVENLCKKAKIKYDRNNFNEISKHLFRFYGEVKENKNIITKEILKHLNLNDKIQNKINIFYINLILLTIAIDICKDDKEKEDLYSQYKEFLFFFVISTVNISSNNVTDKSKNKNKNNNKNIFLLEKIYYNIIGYGFIYLKKNGKTKYNEIKSDIISPIFSQEKKNIFGISKKIVCKSKIIDKLFKIRDSSKDDSNIEGRIDPEINNHLRTATMVENDGFVFNKKKSKKAIKDIDKESENIIFKGDINKIVNEVIEETINIYKSIKTVLPHTQILTFYTKKRDREKNEINNFMGMDNEELNSKIKIEEKRIYNTLKEIIPFLEDEVRKYWNNSCLDQLQRRRDYKKTKKKLFSWNGFWSDKKLFFVHPEYLKLRVKNHFTKEKTKIILTPIIDIDYYLPNFKYFNKDNLFNVDDYKYNISLNVEEILKIEDNKKVQIKNENKGEDDNKNKNENNINNLYNEEKEEEEEKDEEEEKLNEEKNQIDDLGENLNLNNFNNEITSQINISKKKNNKNSIQSNNFKDNKRSIKNWLTKEFNYLESLYRFTFIGIWEQYKRFYKGKMTLDNVILGNKDTFEILIQSKYMSLNEFNSKNENLYICCIVKPTHHIKGYISTEKKSIVFTHCDEDNESEILLEKDPSYDKEMKCCYGSTFKSHIKDREKVFLEIKYSDIHYLLFRNYFYQDTACEIYTFSNKSYYLNFKNNQELQKFTDDILNHILYRTIEAEDFRGKKILGYEKTIEAKAKPFKIKKIMEEWQNNNISTLEYLMWLNIFSGRSFNDMTQYPVLPWLITDYNKGELTKDDYRNLSIPVGMMEVSEKSETRKETFIDFYETLKTDFKEANPDFNYTEYLKRANEYLEEYKAKKNKKKKDNNNNDLAINDINISNIELNQIPFFYGTHYSCPTFVAHFLMRLFPFCLLSIEIQGNKFDDPDRIFISLTRTFETASTLKEDIRELIPEFYTLPEMFLNKNNLNLTQDKLDAEGQKIVVHDVELPPWCNNISYNFISEMRKNLENKELKINKWIDLIFGYLQRGEKAEENHNIFMAQSYEYMVKIDSITDNDARNALMRLVEVGVTPRQIFKSQSKQKNSDKLVTKGNYLYQKQKTLKICVINLKEDLLKKLYTNKTINNEYEMQVYPKIIKIKWIGLNELLIINNSNYLTKIKIKKMSEKCSIEEKNIIQAMNISSKYAPSYLISEKNPPIIFYENNKYMIKGGFWDGRLEINSLITSKEKYLSNYIYIKEGPIVVMEMTKDEKILLCGTKIGFLICFSVNGPSLKIESKIYTHNDEITSININENLNMFVTSSLDGYINMHILPSFELVRSIKLSAYNKQLYNDENELYYANNVFLSSSPLACVSAFISSKKIFRIFTINGEFIEDIQEINETNYIKCPIIFKDLNFQDYIIYGTDDGRVKVRSFPNLELINNIQPYGCNEIISLDISQNKKCCYLWIKENKIFVLKDLFEDVEEDKSKKTDKKENDKEKEKEIDEDNDI